MLVLVACEESQAVCKAFRERGHEAYSCDLQTCSGGHPEWHFLCDALKVLDYHWDLLIAHPPCTYLSNAGANHLFRGHYLDLERYKKGLQGKEFFMKFFNAHIKKICVENPVPSKIYGLPKYTQSIEPYMFGHPYTKKTLLWLKGLPPLKPTNIVKPLAGWTGWHRKSIDKPLRTVRSAKDRSKTFAGIAKAMAEQWGVDD